MTDRNDQSDRLVQQVLSAAGEETPLRVTGGRSKDFYGLEPSGAELDVTVHRGVVNYEPTELILTARAGTPLVDIEELLADNGQMLAFEPPHFAGKATMGGVVAAGLSGPRRPFMGSVRDHVLGTRVINGRGEHMRFGGEVMKNVAGYDVSRLMTGALGTLGVLTEVSVKVLPLPAMERTCIVDCPIGDVFRQVEWWLRDGVPVSATAHDGEKLHVRLSGAKSAVETGARAIGGERTEQPAAFWRSVRDQTHPFFGASNAPLWRLSLPPGAELPHLDGDRFQEWAGKLLWVHTDADAEFVRREAARLGGHATLFRGGDRTGEVFHPLPEPIMAMHTRLKAAFDPKGLFNPGRLYANL